MARETQRDYLLASEFGWTVDQIDRALLIQGPRLQRLLLYKNVADEAEADAIAALNKDR